jgi:hypothetical protein
MKLRFDDGECRHRLRTFRRKEEAKAALRGTTNHGHLIVFRCPTCPSLWHMGPPLPKRKPRLRRSRAAEAGPAP